MNNNACVKIYTESDTVLVCEGLYKTDKEGYYPATGKFGRIGTVVCGKNNISITEDAKKLFKKIIEKAKKTGDDISFLDIHAATNWDVVISWMTLSTDEGLKHKIDIDKLDECEFFIGIGGGYPKLDLLDILSA